MAKLLHFVNFLQKWPIAAASGKVCPLFTIVLLFFGPHSWQETTGYQELPSTLRITLKQMQNMMKLYLVSPTCLQRRGNHRKQKHNIAKSQVSFNKKLLDWMREFVLKTTYTVGKTNSELYCQLSSSPFTERTQLLTGNHKLLPQWGPKAATSSPPPMSILSSQPLACELD